ncbi:MAG: hypothetical protein AB7G80_09025 [Dongiaceae bacterium]
MAWLGLITAVLKAVAELAMFLGNRQLIELGKAKTIADGLALTLANVEKAHEVDRALSADPNSDYANRLRKRFERQDDE